MHAMRPGTGRRHPSRPATWCFAGVLAKGGAFRRPTTTKSASQPRFFAAISRNRADGRRLPSWSRRPRRRLRFPPRDAYPAPAPRAPFALRPSPPPTAALPAADAHPNPLTAAPRASRPPASCAGSHPAPCAPFASRRRLSSLRREAISRAIRLPAAHAHSAPAPCALRPAAGFAPRGRRAAPAPGAPRTPEQRRPRRAALTARAPWPRWR